MREVARNVFRVRGTDVNCVLVREGTELTLIDGGWVGDVPALEKAIRALGRRPEDVRAILLTHAHLDHMGALNHFHERYGVPVYMDPDEVAHARREYVEQATPLDILLRAWRPSVLAWSARISRAGALRRLAVPHARPFPDDGPLDLPGPGRFPWPATATRRGTARTTCRGPGSSSRATRWSPAIRPRGSSVHTCSRPSSPIRRAPRWRRWTRSARSTPASSSPGTVIRGTARSRRRWPWRWTG
nr:hypothetical protein GCM10020241_64410 [Streptoalloteichus tenebrarius]